MAATTAGASPHTQRSRARRSAVARRSGRYTLYDVLQVATRADEAVITAAFRVLARTYHPDLNPDPTAPERMREINAAYRVLNDPRRRAIYDLELNQRRCSHDRTNGVSAARLGDTTCTQCAGRPGGQLPRTCGERGWVSSGAGRGCRCDHAAHASAHLARRAQTASGWFVASVILTAWFVSRMLGA